MGCSNLNSKQINKECKIIKIHRDFKKLINPPKENLQDRIVIKIISDEESHSL